MSLISQIVEAAALPVSAYHPWAHSHWVWLHNGQNNQQNTTDLVNGYLENDILVGGVNIDSTWATQFNNFEVDTNKFPDFAGLIGGLRAQNIRTTLWATSMVNVENPDYDMCVEKNYLVRNHLGKVRPLHWWHGDGALLDYSTPEAVSWWHSKMDLVLDVGVEGFKCDGTDPYIIEYQLLGGAMGYNGQNLTYRQYADMYYGDFFNYSREKRGNSGLIMSRPVDCADNADIGCIDMSPHEVMWSGWMGDDDSSFTGLRSCVRKVIFSAQDNYTNFGCDIGGYRGGDTAADKELFVRWAQLGAFLPLMENGGGGEHRPWMFDDETVRIYRKYVQEHYKLIPYMLTVGNQARESGVSTLAPLATKDPSEPYKHPQPHTFSYRIGQDLLVHPVVTNLAAPEEGEDPAKVRLSQVQMDFPGDATTQWVNYFHPWDADSVHVGDTSVRGAVAFGDYPVFARRGALVPMAPEVSRAAMAEDYDYANSPVLFTWFAPTGGMEESSEVREYEGSGLVGTASLSAEGVFAGSISAHETRAGGFAIYGVTEPESVEIEQIKAAVPCTHVYLEKEAKLSVRCSSLRGGVKVTATGMKNSF